MLKQKFISILCAMAIVFSAIPGGIFVFANDDKIDLGDKVQSGSAGWNGQNNYPNAFDGNTETYFDGLVGGYCQIDLGALYNISALRFYPRDGRFSNKPADEYVSRMIGGVFSGSTDGESWTPIYTVESDIFANKEGDSIIDWYDIAASGTYRYIKYENSQSEANIAEIEVYGTLYEGEDIPTAPTASPAPSASEEPAENVMIDLSDKDQSGSEGWNNQNNYPNAFDGNTETYFDGLQNGYCQVDLGALHNISALRFYPRGGHTSDKPGEYVARMVGGVFSGSIDGSNWTPLYTVPSDIFTNNADASIVKWYDIETSGVYRYIKYENDQNAAT